MQDKLLNYFDYNQETGELRLKLGNRRKPPGTIAGWINALGYRCVLLEGKTYLVHRLIWLMMTGEQPDQVDHINHVRDDNRWCNLRNVSPRDQQLNMQKRRNNSSGVQGVRILPSGRYCAYIMVNRKQLPLGTYDSIEDATAARKAGEIQYGFHVNHGST